MANKRKSPAPSLLRQAITNTAKEYCQKTSLNGFGLLYYIRRRKYQRLFWFLFILLGICCASYVVLYTLYAALGDPTITSPHAPDALIWDLPFPAVAVCSMNKMSRRATRLFAENLMQAAGDGESVGKWEQRLRMLAAVLDVNAASMNKTSISAATVHAQSNMLSNNSVASLLKHLAPQCAYLLLECRWAGEPKNCNQMLPALATPAGQCCVFNYQPQSVLLPVGTLPDQGLMLRLNASADDYMPARSGEITGGGFNLRIFDPFNFPDIDVGYMRQFSVMAGERIDVQLFVSTQRADADAHAVHWRRRGCLFVDEDTSDENGRKNGMAAFVYSHSNCLFRCKVQTIMEECECVPHYAAVDNATTPQCSLQHIACVQQCRRRWYHTVTTQCVHCMPLCTYQRYEQRKQRLGPLPATPDEVVVNLYFPTPVARNTYRKDVIYTWYQVLSNIGGVLGICMGCSFISGFEIIYYLVYRLPAHYRELRRATV